MLRSYLSVLPVVFVFCRCWVDRVMLVFEEILEWSLRRSLSPTTGSARSLTHCYMGLGCSFGFVGLGI